MQGGISHAGGGCEQAIGSSISNAIVRSWLWSTATRSFSLGYFSILLQLVDNGPHIIHCFGYRSSPDVYH